MAAWFPTFERWQLTALEWSVQRALWQRCVICALVGAILGLAMVLGAAGIFGLKRANVAAVAVAPQALARAAAPARRAPDAALPAAVVTPQPVAPAQLVEMLSPEAKPASQAAKPSKKRSHRRRRAVRNVSLL